MSSLPNLLALTFATASLANGLDECLHIYTIVSSGPKSHGPSQQNSTTQAPIVSFQTYFPRFVHLSAYYHMAMHISLWLSCLWSLYIEKTSRSAMAAILFFEFGAMAVAPWIIAAVDRISTARSTRELEAATWLLIRRQLVRLISTHVPSVVTCLYALT